MHISEYPLADVEAIPSPALLYFRRQIESNIDRMLQIAGGARRLRPHVKTFKTMGVVRLYQARGVHAFKCATIAEAEMLAAGGVADILLAYPLVGPNIRRMVDLAVRYPAAQFTVIGDDEAMLLALSEAMVSSSGGGRLKTLVDVDTGLGRTGVEPSQAAALAQTINAMPGLRFAGLHYYDGNNHQYDLSERTVAAAAGYQTIQEIRAALHAAGLEPGIAVMGGTPTFPCYAAYPDVELSPGTCAVHDWGYLQRVPDLPFAPAAAVLGRVISRRSATQMTIDIGSKAIATDPSAQRGVILGYEHFTHVKQNEEHWIFSFDPNGAAAATSPHEVSLQEGSLQGAAEAPPVGTPVLVVPYHVCPTSALYDEILVIDETGQLEARWEVSSRTRRLTI